MMKKIGQLFVVSIMVVFSGCAGVQEAFLEATGYYTLNQAQCVSANWYDIGFLDGDQDRERNSIQRHQTSCARFGVVPNASAYTSGFDDGFFAFSSRYCTEKNGFQLGRSNQSYRDICPEALKNAFLIAYEDGYNLFVVNYCEPDNGFELGRSGESYQDICPIDLQGPFLKAYHHGEKIYNKVTSLNHTIVSLQSDIELAELELLQLASFIDEHCLTNTCHERHLYRTKKMRVDNLKDERRDAKAELAALEVVEFYQKY